jgi:hypothetical protein
MVQIREEVDDSRPKLTRMTDEGAGGHAAAIGQHDIRPEARERPFELVASTAEHLAAPPARSQDPDDGPSRPADAVRWVVEAFGRDQKQSWGVPSNPRLATARHN